MIPLFVITCYFALCFLNAYIAEYKVVIPWFGRVGFWTIFFLSVFFLPVTVFCVLLFLPEADPEKNRFNKLKRKQKELEEALEHELDVERRRIIQRENAIRMEMDEIARRHAELDKRKRAWKSRS